MHFPIFSEKQGGKKPITLKSYKILELSLDSSAGTLIISDSLVVALKIWIVIYIRSSDNIHSLILTTK